MKSWFGVGAVVLLAALACGSGEERTVEMEDGGTASVHGDDEGVRVRGTTEDGEKYEIRVGSKAELPDDFPDDVPVHPGASVEASMSMPGEGQMITFATQSAPDAVYRFYKDGLAKQGWSIEAEMNLGGQRMLSGRKGDRVASVQLVEGDEGGTRIVVTVAEDD